MTAQTPGQACETAQGAPGPLIPVGSTAIMRLPELARAPWSESQVASLNAFQASGAFHPFTCGNDDCPGVNSQHASLVARRGGWHCPACDYTQDWAHAFMAEWLTP